MSRLDGTAGIQERKVSQATLARRQHRKELAKRLGLRTWSQAIEAFEEDILPAIDGKMSSADIARAIKTIGAGAQ